MYKKIIKKFMICLTCCMLIFASCVKSAKAFVLVDDLAIAAILCGLAAVSGVVVNNDTFRENASELLSSACDSYAEFFGQAYDDAKASIASVASKVYDGGTILANEFNDMLHGWFGNWINTSVLADYSLPVGSTPIFADGVLPTNLFYTSSTIELNPAYPHAGVNNYDLYGNGKWALIWREPKSNNFYGIGDNNTTNQYVYQLKIDSKMNYYSSYKMANDTTTNWISWNITGKEFYSNGTGRVIPSIATLAQLPLQITGLASILIVYNGVTMFYNHITKKWTKDMEGTLELDPGAFNTDSLGDIDIAPPWAKMYDDLTKSIDFTGKFVLGNDVTFDNTGDMTFPGTIAIPRDYTDDFVDSKDYPLVIPTDVPKVDDIPKDDVIDHYPSWNPPNMYTADWSTVFPFCIPFDIFRFLGLLSATPKAPHFKWDYNFMGMKGSLDVNLNKFDDVAEICRTLFDVLFIVGLAMVTRSKMIRA